MDTRNELMKVFRNAVENNNSILPSEVELSSSLGISRTQIRDYLAQFENEKFITRHRGRGTMVIKDVLNIPLRMDFTIEYLKRLEIMGFKGKSEIVNKYVSVSADFYVAEKLEVSEGTPVIKVTTYAKADGKTVIYTEEFLSFKSVQSYNMPPLSEIKDNLFDFIRKYCGGAEIDFVLSELTPVLAKKTIATTFDIDEGSLLQLIEETAYTDKSEKLLFTKEYYLPEYLKYTILRKRGFKGL